VTCSIIFSFPRSTRLSLVWTLKLRRNCLKHLHFISAYLRIHPVLWIDQGLSSIIFVELLQKILHIFVLVKACTLLHNNLFPEIIFAAPVLDTTKPAFWTEQLDQVNMSTNILTTIIWTNLAYQIFRSQIMYSTHAPLFLVQYCIYQKHQQYLKTMCIIPPAILLLRAMSKKYIGQIFLGRYFM
jgi:hypothetical protein